MEPHDVALSEVHVAEHHQKVGVLEVHNAALTSVTDGGSHTTGTTGSTATATVTSSSCPASHTGTHSIGSNAENERTTDSDTLCGAETRNYVTSDYNSVSYEVCRTRFVFDPVTPESPPTGQCASLPLEYDEDGDLVIQRRSRRSQVIHIDHTLATRLLHVGLQVWQGCLLLCDFILDRKAEFEGKIALELGGGVGLASVVMATVAKRVICTDTGDSLLALCQKNTETNQHLYDQIQDCKEDRILVKELDWTEESVTKGTKSKFHWTPDDMKLLTDVTVLFAADVVYDADLTEAFLYTATRLLSTPPYRVLYVALERRLNFTLDDLEVACPAYEHFVSCLEQLRSDGLYGVRLDSEQIGVNFPQCFDYNRTPQLVLWKIMPTTQVT